jgi:hypothetical protein
MEQENLPDDDSSSKKKQRQRDEKKWEQAEQILATVRSGWSLYIFRSKPSWCSGYLERVELGEDEPIDMDYLIEEWGGQVLQLKLADEQGKFRGNAAVKLMSYPVRHHGVRLRRSDLMQDDYDHFSSARKQADQISLLQQQLDPRLLATNAANPQLEMMNLLKVMQSARKEDLHLLQMIYQANKGGSGVPGQNPMKDMLNTAKAYSEMQKIFGGNNNSNEQQPQNEDMALLTTVGDIAKAVINRPKGDVVKSLPNPRISEPKPEQYPPQQVPNQIGSDSEISGAMANMTPERVNEILLTSLQKMPDDKREKVFEVFEKRTGLSFYDPSMVEEQDGDDEQDQEQHQTPRRSRIPQDPHKV